MQKRLTSFAPCFISMSWLAFTVTQPACAATYTVGPGQSFSTPEEIAWNSIHPGDVIVINPGTYPSLLGTGNSMTINGVAGTQAQPITIQGSSSINLPHLNAGISISGGSQYISINNLDVSRNPSTQQYAAVVVQSKSSHILLSGLNVHNSFVGVEFAQAGLGNVLRDSQIYDNVMQGVTPQPADASFSPDVRHRSFVIGNDIHDNGSHGIEITGSFWTIDRNQVTHNGLSTSGTSGIHVYSTTDIGGVAACYGNRISYNYVTTQQDYDGVDGNGIQIDDFCNDNRVAFNVLWANAGAGISVLDSMDNTVVSNTTYSNATDTVRAQTYPGVFRGEIILGSMANLCSNPNVLHGACVVAPGQSSGNAVYDNIIVSGQMVVPGIFVSPDAAVDNTNRVYPNLYYNLGSATSGLQLLWNNAAYNTASAIDVITGQTGQGDGSLIELPDFLNPADIDANGLALIRKPTNAGRVITPPLPDMTGSLPVPGTSYYGAYYEPN